MGMFDNIKVKKDLPLTNELKNLSVDWKNVVFQTKDLINVLNDYTITEDGVLLLEHVECEYVYYTEEEKKQKGNKPWEIVKETIEKSRQTETVDFHGKILFYTHESLNDEEDVWVDFEAYFIYGKLDKINLVKVEKFKSSKFSYEKWAKEENQKTKKLSYKAKKCLGWFWFLKFIIKSCNKLSYGFQNINTFIYKHML
jgi:hypothetical protein